MRLAYSEVDEMSLLCWIRGHAWEFSRSNHEEKGGWVTRTRYYFTRSHCERCGKENPAWLGSADKIACKAVEKAKQ